MKKKKKVEKGRGGELLRKLLEKVGFEVCLE
jgi:hypothetical protein